MANCSKYRRPRRVRLRTNLAEQERAITAGYFDGHLLERLNKSLVISTKTWTVALIAEREFLDL